MTEMKLLPSGHEDLPKTVDGMLALIAKRGLKITGLSQTYEGRFACYVGTRESPIMSDYVRADTALGCITIAYRSAAHKLGLPDGKHDPSAVRVKPGGIAEQNARLGAPPPKSEVIEDDDLIGHATAPSVASQGDDDLDGLLG